MSLRDLKTQYQTKVDEQVTDVTLKQTLETDIATAAANLQRAREEVATCQAKEQQLNIQLQALAGKMLESVKETSGLSVQIRALE